MSESARSLKGTPIRDLGLKIVGTQLEPIVARFLAEIDEVGLSRVRPRLYLSTEWGVPEHTIALAIPFYLASPELTELHRQKGELVEGNDPDDILRYLRHELGHVVNYAYRLFDEPEWVRLFGSITQPYLEEYRPQPFHPGFVSHLPGWYAQMHPDEDWAETFAVWMTSPAWREEYAGRPALAKLLFVDATVARARSLPPLVADDELDEDVSEIGDTLDDLYGEDDEDGDGEDEHEALPVGLDGALRSIADDAPRAGAPTVAALIARLAPDLGSSVFRWTGHFPDKTRALLRRLERRAAGLGLTIDPAREAAAIVALTTLVTSLAMNHVMTGRYQPRGAK